MQKFIEVPAEITNESSQLEHSSYVMTEEAVDWHRVFAAFRWSEESRMEAVKSVSIDLFVEKILFALIYDKDEVLKVKNFTSQLHHLFTLLQGQPARVSSRKCIVSS